MFDWHKHDVLPFVVTLYSFVICLILTIVTVCSYHRQRWEKQRLPLLLLTISTALFCLDYYLDYLLNSIGRVRTYQNGLLSWIGLFLAIISGAVLISIKVKPNKPN